MDYQIKPKQAKHGSSDQEIFEAITDFQTSGISTKISVGFIGLMSRLSRVGTGSTIK